LCDESTEATKAIGVYGEQEWKGEKFDGLTRTTIVVGREGVIVGILQGIKAEEHAAKALGLLAG
jgi:peroxiredoxin Q/BCP